MSEKIVDKFVSARVVSKECKNIEKSIREDIEGLIPEEKGEFAGTIGKITKVTKTIKKFDMAEAEKLVKGKDIVDAKILSIKMKSGVLTNTIPKEVLDGMTKYFDIEPVFVFDESDVKEWVADGKVTEAELESMYSIKKSVAISTKENADVGVQDALKVLMED